GARAPPAPPQLAPAPGPEQAVVLTDEHPRPRHAWLRVVAARGIVSDPSVPSPGALRTLARPPRRAIRARTDSARPFRSDGTAAGSNPLPRSRTNTDTSPGSTSANRETTVAPDHFTAL